MNGVDGHYHLRGIEPGHDLGQVVLVLTEQSENISLVHDKILERGGREEGGGREGGCERHIHCKHTMYMINLVHVYAQGKVSKEGK